MYVRGSWKGDGCQPIPTGRMLFTHQPCKLHRRSCTCVRQSHASLSAGSSLKHMTSAMNALDAVYTALLFPSPTKFILIQPWLPTRRLCAAPASSAQPVVQQRTRPAARLWRNAAGAAAALPFLQRAARAAGGTRAGALEAPQLWVEARFFWQSAWAAAARKCGVRHNLFPGKPPQTPACQGRRTLGADSPKSNARRHRGRPL
jgi:hypothetical protein